MELFSWKLLLACQIVNVSIEQKDRLFCKKNFYNFFNKQPIILINGWAIWQVNSNPMAEQIKLHFKGTFHRSYPGWGDMFENKKTERTKQKID